MQDAFDVQDAGEFAKDINDIAAAILAIETTLGNSPAGAHPTVKAALDGLNTSFVNLNSTFAHLQTTQLNLASEVAALSAVPGPPNTFFRFVQTQPSALWDITHPLGRLPSVTVIDSAGSVVEGEIDFVSNSRLTITFSAAFAGEAGLS
jgi:hypothetical protein